MVSSHQPGSTKGSAPGQPAPVALLLLASLGLGAALVLSANRPMAESDITNRPVQVAGDSYISSNTCQACHPSEYETWYGSFHRTMTQVATPETVRADFDGVRVENVHGRPMQLDRDGADFWAEFDDPGW